MSIAYLNGEYLPLADARISPLDRGFLFGDAVYEVIPVYQGKLFLPEKHLGRLHDSLKALHISETISDRDFISIFTRLVTDNPAPAQSIYLQITRGSDHERHHMFHDDLTPTIFIYSAPLKEAPIEEKAKGLSAITAEDIRWGRCDIKTVNLLPNILLQTSAKAHDASDTILCRGENVSEATSSSVFITKNNRLTTTPLDFNILPSVTREYVIGSAKALGIDCEERIFTRNEMMAADNVWLVSSTKEIVPVNKIDGQAIGDGKGNALWEKLINAYQQDKTK